MSGQGIRGLLMLLGTLVATRLGPARRGREDGASAVEYGLLIAGIAAIIAVAVFVLGDVTISMFETTCNEFDAQASVSASC
jgi:pilus assembly protein Flp/PilA